MQARIITIVICASLLISGCSQAQKTSFSQIPFNNKLDSKQDSLVHKMAEKFFGRSDAPGLLVCVASDGKENYYSYGYAIPAEEIAFTENTVFEAGSITKTFVANLLLQLQWEGLLNIHEPISTYLPDSVQNSYTKYMTLAEIASHISGLPRLPPNYQETADFNALQPYKNYGDEHLYSYLSKVEGLKPGGYEYSNLGFGLLGTIMERRTGKSLEELFQQYIFSPLQMEQSDLKGMKGEIKAQGHLSKQATDFWEFNAMAGAGAIKTTAADMMMYLKAHLRNNDSSLFGKAAVVTLQPGVTVSQNLKIGYGWHILNMDSLDVYWHNGGTYGFSTFAAFNRESGLAIFAVANSFNQAAMLDPQCFWLINEISNTQ